MGIFDIFRRKPEVDADAKRREFLTRSGRITDGTIIDSEISETGDEIVYYLYSVNGTDFESSEILTEDQRRDPLKYAPGAKVGIKFDPKNHGNSILD